MRRIFAASLALLAGSAFGQCLEVAELEELHVEFFNVLEASGGNHELGAHAIGWHTLESGGARADALYVADTGADAQGDTYSYGAPGDQDRALGTLRDDQFATTVGLCVRNLTGGAITSLIVERDGAQWRAGNTGPARLDRLEFSYSVDAGDLASGTWAALPILDVTSLVPTVPVAGAIDGNRELSQAGANIAGLDVPDGATIWLRWADVDVPGDDDGLALDRVSVRPMGPDIEIANVSRHEGDAGTTTFTFNVSLSQPAGAGGVRFTIGTANFTAQHGTDYVYKLLTGQVIPAGASTYSFDVLVNGDTVAEGNEFFFVRLSNIVGAQLGNFSANGTIINDDVTPIHVVQGSGARSPYAGNFLAVRGIVTGVTDNGFFLQLPDAEADANPLTSEGIYVAATPPPANVVIGNLVRTSGTVSEFVPATDALQPPRTQLNHGVTVLLDSGRALPAPVLLGVAFPDAAGAHDQLERLEGMRVAIAELEVTGPTGGWLQETAATATSNGIFLGVATGTPRPFGETGIQAPDPPPTGSIPPIPRWDANPELLAVDSDALAGSSAKNVGVGATVTGLVGPLFYQARRYTLLPDPDADITTAAGPQPTVVPAPEASDITLASYNLQRFFDDADDPARSDVVLTPAAFETRLAKASLGIRDALRSPDIIAVQEVENLATLQALAARISADAVAAGQPDPQYEAVLIEGRDPTGLDTGALVKTAPVDGKPRVHGYAEQLSRDATYHDPGAGRQIRLYDRPPVIFHATVNFGFTSSVLDVVLVHPATRDGIDDRDVSGASSVGASVRARRLAQARDIAGWAASYVPLAVLGDFESMPFNDGFVDVMGTIAGTPVPDDQTVVPGDGDVHHDSPLDNLLENAPLASRYSTVQGGNAQAVDHVLVNKAQPFEALRQRIAFARINADFPESARNDAGSALRLSDHDPVVAYLKAMDLADVSVSLSDAPDPATAGGLLTYVLTVTNAGPDPAYADIHDELPAGTTFESLSIPPGWACGQVPAVGANGPVSCFLSQPMPPGSQQFTLVVKLDADIDVSVPLVNTVETTTSGTVDPEPGNNRATASTSVVAGADVALAMTAAPDPVAPGTALSYTITLAQNGPSVASNVQWRDTLPAGTTFASLATPAGWTCSTPAAGAGGDVACSIATLAPGSSAFVLGVAVDGAVAPGSTITNSATANATSSDPQPGNDTATATVTLGAASADLSVVISRAPSGALAGTNIGYEFVVANAGPASAASVSVSAALPAGTRFVSLAVPAGFECDTPALGEGGAIACMRASMPVNTDAAFELVLAVDSALADGASIVAAFGVDSATADPDASDDTASITTPVQASADLSVALTPAAPAPAGSLFGYSLAFANAGPGDARSTRLLTATPPHSSFVSLDIPAGWTCDTPASGEAGKIVCARDALVAGSTTFQVVARIDADALPGTTLSATATVESGTADPVADNNAVTATITTVIAPLVEHVFANGFEASSLRSAAAVAASPAKGSQPGLSAVAIPATTSKLHWLLAALLLLAAAAMAPFDRANGNGVMRRGRAPRHRSSGGTPR